MDTQNTKRQPRFFIETYGCQMNKYDSELIAGLLEIRGHAQAATMEEADTVIVNTCAVREHAEIRAIGRINSLAGWKNQQEGRKLGVVGCMAQRLADQLLDSIPALDFVMGPDAYRKLPDILDNGRHDEGSGAAVETGLDTEEQYSQLSPSRESGTNAWIAIMRGCNNFCSYCIVPYTRGRERSRPINEIIVEFNEIIDSGYREVTLLGQNVNSYKDEDSGTLFPELLGRLSRERPDTWIRFMTSHPKDVSLALLDVMAEEANVCEHLHLPIQSGSNSVLESMNRKYTREHYLDMVGEARKRIPDISLTTDIMVGFPGETEEDFENTLQVLETVRYNDAFMYHYSPRQGTKSASLEETISQAEKLRRLDILIKKQRQIALEIKQEMVGSTVTVLPEGRSKRNDREWMGRTRGNHVIVLTGDKVKIGTPVSVGIKSLRGATLRGEILR